MNLNIVDFALLAILGISIIWGLYRGFIQSLLNTGASLLSLVGSFFLYPAIANTIQKSEDLVLKVIYYTDASSRIGDLELSTTKINELTASGLETVMQNADLSAPFDGILSHNITNQVYAATGASTVADYVSQTIVSAAINILCFFLCFVVLYLIFSIIINMLRVVFRFPLLKKFDWLLGAVLGIVRGIVFCYIAFTLIPLLSMIIHLEPLDTLLAQSTLATYFNNGNLILSIMNRRF
ncbi:MAG: CvpA family protein [Clostridiales bacterium]|nr:CvpA family protein [Clostridiales bacterium]